MYIPLATHLDGFLAAPIAHCHSIFHLEAVLGGIATSATSFLFLSRIRAVFERSIVVTVVFSVFWIAVVISSVADLFVASATVRLPRYIHSHFSCQIRASRIYPAHSNALLANWDLGQRTFCG